MGECRMRGLRRSFFFAALFLISTTASRANDVSPIRVLTFNTWLLSVSPFYKTDHLESRLRLMPYMIKELNADVILLQEVWGLTYRNQLIEEFSQRGYSEFAYTQQSNGLLTVSRFPIVAMKSIKFSENTAFLETFESKGVMKTEIQIPDFGSLDVYNTHLGSVAYDSSTRKFNHSHLRTLEKQVQELQDFVVDTQTHQNFIIGGDFNFHYDIWLDNQYWPAPSDLYERILGNWNFNLRLKDAARKFFKSNRETPYTYSRENPYILNGNEYDGPSATLDYIFYSRKKSQLKPLQSHRVFTEAVSPDVKEKLGLPELPLRLSDHFGLFVDFELLSEPQSN
jgi:endonuclease/exonuclease/phosphatase family metal-dependent hydrolase